MTEQLSGKRILVVEDEYFIASDLKRALSAAAAVVVGPVGDVESGMAEAGQPLDAAVLDVNLEGATTFAIADRLSAREVPYMFLTGYDGWALPARYRTVPRLGKPFTAKGIVQVMEQLVAPAGAVS